MNNFILSQKNKLLKNIEMLDELSININKIDIQDKQNFVNKLIGYGHNIDIISDNTIDLLKDIGNNKCNLSDETSKMLEDDEEVLNFINDIKPFLVYHFYNRKSLMTGRSSWSS